MTKRKQQPSKLQKAKAEKRPSGAPKVPQSTSLTSRFSPKLLIGVVGLLIVVIGAVIFVQAQANGQNTVQPYVVGSVHNCANISPFMRSLGFVQNSALDTRSKFVKGIAIRQFDQQGNVTRTYQDPSWSSAGFLGAFERDEAGNVYVIPVPAINILDNPPQKANMLYRIDGTSGAMAPLIELPSLAPPNSQNPYGLLGITYDCDTGSLYMSSVYGSTYEQTVGRIFQVDSKTGKVLSSLDHVDAFGVGVFNTIKGKRLYFGLARTPDIYSVALDNKGVINGEIRPEPALTVAGATSDERAQAITFQDPNRLTIKAIQFDFNLIAPTEIRNTLLTYDYDYTKDSWTFVSSDIFSS